MNGLVLHCNFNHLILRTHHKHGTFSKFSHKLRLHLQNESTGNCWEFEKRKPIKKFNPSVDVRAASSSSPSLGASAPDFPEPLFGGQVKKKRRSIAGIDQDELVDPRNLADPDSCFCEFKGVDVHYKICEPESETPALVQDQISSQLVDDKGKIGLPMILLHGFGASAFSWHRVMKPFSQIMGSKVLAFDRPAFGLTSRVIDSVRSQEKDDTTPLNPYSMAFSVLATLYFIDFLASTKAVLVGHSAGALTAVETYFEAPERVAALILVAPAILAPISAVKVAEKNQSDKENSVQKSNSDVNASPTLFGRVGQILSKLYRYVMTSVTQLLRRMMEIADSLYKKALAAILRSAIGLTVVRLIIDKFGIAAVKNAWYDGTKVDDHILHGYTKPLRTQDWDRALVEFTAAMFTNSQAKLKPPLQNRLQDITCPVLIITGDNDRLVPAWNAERLSRVIPGSQLEIIQKCGHLPQEERPNEFVSVVARFLQSVFAGSEELCMQA